jgi:DNA transposition AAA+ family ATPase
MTTTAAPASPDQNNPANTGSYGIATQDAERVFNGYPSSAREVIRFWFFLGKERSWSLTKLAEVTGVSTTVLSRLFRGVYPAGLDSVVATLAKARDQFSEAVSNPDFIETSLYKRMAAVYDKTRTMRNVSMMWGEIGIGKTECTEEYHRRNNHGFTQLVRFPAGATFAYFVAHVARAVGVSTRSQSQFLQRDKIIQTLAAGRRLLIVDEFHQAFLTTRNDTAVRCCEFLREIADVAKAGLALIGSNALPEHVFRGPHKAALAQLVDRGTVQIPLPAKPTKADIRAFLRNYGLALPGDSEPEAAAILSDILASTGLRKLTLHLRDGAAYAARLSEPYSWSHFLSAFEALASLAKS